MRVSSERLGEIFIIKMVYALGKIEGTKGRGKHIESFVSHVDGGKKFISSIYLTKGFDGLWRMAEM